MRASKPTIPMGQLQERHCKAKQKTLLRVQGEIEKKDRDNRKEDDDPHKEPKPRHRQRSESEGSLLGERTSKPETYTGER